MSRPWRPSKAAKAAKRKLAGGWASLPSSRDRGGPSPPWGSAAPARPWWLRLPPRRGWSGALPGALLSAEPCVPEAPKVPRGAFGAEDNPPDRRSWSPQAGRTPPWGRAAPRLPKGSCAGWPHGPLGRVGGGVGGQTPTPVLRCVGEGEAAGAGGPRELPADTRRRPQRGRGGLGAWTCGHAALEGEGASG